MTTFASVVLAAIALTGPSLAVAAGQAVESSSKPSSYAPRPHAHAHVYGSPIEPPITRHATASQHAHGHKKGSTDSAARHAHRAPAPAPAVATSAHSRAAGPQASAH